MFLEGVYGIALLAAWEGLQCSRCFVRAELDIMTRCLSIHKYKCLPVAIAFDSSFTHSFAGILLKAKWEIH